MEDRGDDEVVEWGAVGACSGWDEMIRLSASGFMCTEERGSGDSADVSETNVSVVVQPRVSHHAPIDNGVSSWLALTDQYGGFEFSSAQFQFCQERCPSATTAEGMWFGRFCVYARTPYCILPHFCPPLSSYTP